MAIQIESRGGQITQQLQAAQHCIIADRLHIANIIYNLLDNANKYSPNEPLISVKTESTDKGVRISISDNGLGISKEMQGKIFEKFFRVPTGNIHDVKGFGLGLSYVKTMVEAHQGQISVKSELQQGSTFSVFLPYQQHEA
jgi:two-component system phosphate regulon sensor histidine kinase PhoR